MVPLSTAPYQCTVPTSIVDHRRVFGVRILKYIFVPQKPYDDLRCSWVRCICTVRRVRWLNVRTVYEGTMAACSCTPVCCAIFLLCAHCIHRIPTTVDCRHHTVPSYPLHHRIVAPYRRIPYHCTVLYRTFVPYHRTTVPYPAPYLDLPYQLHTYLELRQYIYMCTYVGSIPPTQDVGGKWRFIGIPDPENGAHPGDCCWVGRSQKLKSYSTPTLLVNDFLFWFSCSDFMFSETTQLQWVVEGERH